MNSITFVGLDVHKDFISVAVAFPEGEPQDWGDIPNNPKAVERLTRKLGPGAIFCYEAGPCGYTIYRQLERLGFPCVVAAPSLIPEKPGERKKKTNRLDAKKLARLLRSGDLTPVWVPNEDQEALRDLIRAREEAVRDCTRKKQQLSKFLLRLGHYPPPGVKAWSARYFAWLKELPLAQEAHRVLLAEYLRALEEATARRKRLEEALKHYTEKGLDPDSQPLFLAWQALQGVGPITSLTFLAEIIDPLRFTRPAQLMSYTGAVPGERSSGHRRRQGGITHTGNAHLRAVAVEAAWHYRHRPKQGWRLKKRQKGLSPEVIAIAQKAQERLHNKYWRLIARGKPPQVAVVAVARELLGFVWAIARQIAKERAALKAA